MLGLPVNTTSAMLYAPRCYRRLGLLRCKWEAPLQHWSLAKKLATVNDTIFPEIFDYDDEVFTCSARLGLEVVSMETTFNIRKAMQILCDDAFNDQNDGDSSGCVHRLLASIQHPRSGKRIQV
ncbi:hypothetical protein O3M35_007315 [Rhynocoris fuscipes]|uniref:Uncharacterized protein n=1 Tax=Rhynocoris fuscipes TaxID=488301 RepID=A0AAW1D957_9HEMI